MRARPLSGIHRNTIWEQMNGQHVDLLVIGGGITGCGIALDAASRGIRTLLVEMQDFAAGTSSRSTKLVHGGLRYLKQFEVKMVAEVGKERAVVYENGPHVTTPEWMMLPFYKGGTFGYWSTSLGLLVYDRLAGVKRSERRKMMNLGQTLLREPLLKRERLRGSGYYVEYRTDDARLTIEVLKRAVELGATALNYVKAEQFLYENGKLAGARLVDQMTGDAIDVKATIVVNAAGPWVDTLREMDCSKDGRLLRLTKGVHLVFDQSRFPLKQAIYFDTPDKRMMFAIPRNGKTYVGTTDTFYGDDIANPKMTGADREYILHAVNDMFPKIQITEEDVESSWAGVRPLIFEEGKDPSEISRKDEVWQSPSGLLTIAGGKLTGYRKMAETVVDRVSGRLAKEKGMRIKPCGTKHLPVSGGDVGGSAGFPQFVADKAKEAEQHGLSAEAGRKLAAFFGSNVGDVLAAGGPEAQAAAERYGLPPELYLTLLYAVGEEMTLTPTDFFIRRTGALLFNIKLVRKYKSGVLACMKDLLGWDDDAAGRYAEELERQLHDAVEPSDAG